MITDTSVLVNLIFNRLTVTCLVFICDLQQKRNTKKQKNMIINSNELIKNYL